jgi:hypothetical protein
MLTMRIGNAFRASDDVICSIECHPLGGMECLQCVSDMPFVHQMMVFVQLNATLKRQTQLGYGSV